MRSNSQRRRSRIRRSMSKNTELRVGNETCSMEIVNIDTSDSPATPAESGLDHSPLIESGYDKIVEPQLPKDNHKLIQESIVTPGQNTRSSDGGIGTSEPFCRECVGNKPSHSHADKTAQNSKTFTVIKGMEHLCLDKPALLKQDKYSYWPRAKKKQPIIVQIRVEVIISKKSEVSKV